MSLRSSSQILAIASLSSPQFDANPFLPPAAMCPICWGFPHRGVETMAPELRLWESADYSNQVSDDADLERVGLN